MRELVLDTETTGFDPNSGDRIVEIGIVELVNHLPTGETYHVYINPERSMPKDAYEVHGLGDEFLADKPKFREIVDGFLEFVGADPLVIHNASFDMKFLNAELSWLNKPQLPYSQAVDTLEIARKKFPGAQNSLDALCRRFGVDNSGREKHGALLDSELLAEVYLELVGGRQPGFELASDEYRRSTKTQNLHFVTKRPAPLPSKLTEDEEFAHIEFVKTLSAETIWGQIDEKYKKPS